jgi:translin
MEGLTEAIDIVTNELSGLEKDRESSISASRKVIRLTKNVIHCVHIGEHPQELIDELVHAVDLMMASCKDNKILYSGPVSDALAEFAEAMIFVHAIYEDHIPDCRTLGIDAGSWILGLADSIGELRRMVLSHLTSGDIESAKDVFSVMEAFNDQLMLLDVPDAIAPIRRKQDIARGIMDRTRSDITMATIMSR